MVTIVGGVDEAGRGCVVGPLVVAGVSTDRHGISALKELGVRDSKLLTPRRRSTLYGEILKVCERVHTEMIYPGEIDRVVRSGKKYRKLNFLEAKYFAKVVDRLGASRVLMDAPDTVPDRFQSFVAEHLNSTCALVARHKADRDFTVVSAASVVAKVERDRAVEKLRKDNGDFGSGYPSDPATRIFFTELLRRGEPLPKYVRKSWKTWAKLEQNLLAPF